MKVTLVTSFLFVLFSQPRWGYPLGFHCGHALMAMM